MGDRTRAQEHTHACTHARTRTRARTPARPRAHMHARARAHKRTHNKQCLVVYAISVMMILLPLHWVGDQHLPGIWRTGLFDIRAESVAFGFHPTTLILFWVRGCSSGSFARYWRLRYIYIYMYKPL